MAKFCTDTVFSTPLHPPDAVSRQHFMGPLKQL